MVSGLATASASNSGSWIACRASSTVCAARRHGRQDQLIGAGDAVERHAGGVGGVLRKFHRLLADELSVRKGLEQINRRGRAARSIHHGRDRLADAIEPKRRAPGMACVETHLNCCRSIRQAALPAGAEQSRASKTAMSRTQVLGVAITLFIADLSECIIEFTRLRAANESSCRS